MENLISDAWFAMGGGGGDQPASGKDALIQMLCMFGPLFAIMYVLILRPQSQQRKKLEAMVKALKPGDKVIAAGILGTVVTVKDKSVTLRSADSKLEVSKGAVESIVNEDADKD
ncbi:MAG: preprotein translocase subunit YajC [Verrucomicrobiota bacterium]|nr:preprotein translocase subunit YajC [Verrucomicrobiota bacterium]